MGMRKRFLSVMLSCAVLLSGCGAGETGGKPEAAGSGVETKEETVLEQIDMTRWQYEPESDVYWQTGVAYCADPADAAYENLGVYVPGAYFTAVENSDGTYTCAVNAAGTVGNFTAETAPIVLPVSTPGYTAMSAPTGYDSAAAPYTSAGFVYVRAGCRGRDAGAPAGVTDLKAAIRYIRYNGELLPGSTERIFSFGMSGGGAQSALLGATGDSALYTPYLEAIGAVGGVSDAVAGAMCWCPITSLDYASEAYEWNLGVTRTGLTEEMQALSDAMAEQFALYINDLGLEDGDGSVLTLEPSEDGIYQAGSYYDYLKGVIETSLNHFLSDTQFPYSAGDSGLGGQGGLDGGREAFGGKDGVGFGPMDGELPDLEDLDGQGFGGGKGGPVDGELPDLEDLDGQGFGRGKGGPMDGELPALEDADGAEDYHALDGIDRNETSGGVALSGVYKTAQDYIDALNAQTSWVSYDSAANTASITSIADFVLALKLASKDLGAFDALDGTQGENILFGDGDGTGAHFDAVMARLLAGSEYGTAFAEDLARRDALGVSVEDRVNMYNPLYYLCEYYDGCGTANVAPYWRIRTGINQNDTALTTEVNLALALESYGAEVDFETVWGQAHVRAERTGDSTDNFIAWVEDCCQ